MEARRNGKRHQGKALKEAREWILGNELLEAFVIVERDESQQNFCSKIHFA